MKKLVFLFVAVVLTAISANTFAQSSGTAPYPGATHTYSVTNTSGTFDWSVYLINEDNSLTEVTEYAGSEIAGFTESTNEVEITWAGAVTVGNQFLVMVKHTETGCTNTKAIPVTITATTFDLLVTAGSDACYTNDVVVAWDGTAVTYDHGQATVTYNVTASGVNATDDWHFQPDITSTITSDLTVVSVTVNDGTSDVTVNGDGTYTLIGNETATVTVLVENDAPYNNSSDVDAQNITITMTLSEVTLGAGGAENDSDTNTGDVDVTRPNTSGIIAN